MTLVRDVSLWTGTSITLRGAGAVGLDLDHTVTADDRSNAGASRIEMAAATRLVPAAMADAPAECCFLAFCCSARGRLDVGDFGKDVSEFGEGWCREAGAVRKISINRHQRLLFNRRGPTHKMGRVAGHDADARPGRRAGPARASARNRRCPAYWQVGESVQMTYDIG